MSNQERYSEITGRIIAALEAGTVPWRQPWSTSGPISITTGKPYRGVNRILLGCLGYERPYFLTLREAGKRGGRVKKGEHGYRVYFWKFLEKKDPETGELTTIPWLKFDTVFNIEQTTGVKFKAPAVVAKASTPIDAAEEIVAGYKNPPVMLHNDRAYYSSRDDVVSIPDRRVFDTPEDFYLTLFHELVHSTGHKARLNREMGIAAGFGSKDYVREELVAEIGAAFLSGQAGLDPVPANCVSYIAGWLDTLRKDSSAIMWAASRAQAAADHILGEEVSYDSPQA
jgi:antirestriction protein ArdC